MTIRNMAISQLQVDGFNFNPRLNQPAWRTPNTEEAQAEATQRSGGAQTPEHIRTSGGAIGDALSAFQALGSDATTEETVAAARNIVNAFNTAIAGVDRNDGQGSARFADALIGAAIQFAPSLERAGITLTENGRLAINTERITAAAEDGSLNRLFTDNSFASRLERISFNAVHTRSFANAPPPTSQVAAGLNLDGSTVNLFG
jgi:hypothetical protein